MAEITEYRIRVNGKAIVVPEKVYTEYYRMRRRERYLEESDLVHGKVLYANMDTSDLLGEEMIPDFEAESVEDMAVTRVMIERLRECLDMLDVSERELIQALFFDGLSERRAATVFGLSQKGINKRKSKILLKLRKMIES